MEEAKEESYVEINISERQFKILKFTGLIFLFIGLYFVLSNFPIFSSPVIDPNTGLLLIFITGLLTSVHCVGMCSGFVLAYTTKNSENSSDLMSKNTEQECEEKNYLEITISERQFKILKYTGLIFLLKNLRLAHVKQHFLYNISRLSSYTFFGILAGLIGSIFLLTSQFRGYLSIFAGVFMMLYGLSIFFPWLRRITTIRTPSLVKYTRNRGPVIFGLLNGLMPCGPLQAMLIYAASTGSAIQGGITMLTFGLGTIPLMFGFGNAISFLTHNFIGKIMKVSAIVVMVLGLVTLNRGLLLSGYGLPLPSFNLLSSTQGKNPATGLVTAAGNYQEINMKVDRYGWNPDTFVVKKGVPVKWNIYVEKLTYCFQGIRVPKYGLSYDFTKEGETVTLEFTPNEVGTIPFTCWMGMARGEIIVKEDTVREQPTQYKKEPGVAILKIRGMCCSGCARYIEKLVSQIDGVKSAQVDFTSRKATVNFDPEKTSVEKIISTIKSTGRYDAEEFTGG
jgi:sulfite exporter TauE/SafE/copper chaperone CopZ